LKFAFEATQTPLYESKLLDLDSSNANSILNWFPKFDQKESVKMTIEWWDKFIEDNYSASELIDEQIRLAINS
jgi:nucleoside-diphosphate-sugar epimerase